MADLHTVLEEHRGIVVGIECVIIALLRSMSDNDRSIVLDEMRLQMRKALTFDPNPEAIGPSLKMVDNLFSKYGHPQGELDEPEEAR